MRLLFFTCVLCSLELIGQVNMTMLSQHTLTPNSSDSAGVFSRTFYNSGRNMYYNIYAGRAGTSGSMNYFRWREYDAGFVYTGNSGTLAGHGAAGDFAMEQVGTDYYHITAAPPYNFKLSKYDEDFNLINSITFQLDTSDSQADMLFNYTNGKLVVGAMHVPGEYHPTMPIQQASWTLQMHKWEFDLNLIQQGAAVMLTHEFTTWGASCFYSSNNNMYNIVTMRKWPQFSLNVYRYDTSWNYVDSVHLNNDGQWSQGIVTDGLNYYVSYHSGHEHRSGNITLAAYNTSWQLLYDTVITNNSNMVFNVSPPLATTQHNANRPYLQLKGDTLIVSYDVDDYILNSFTPLYYSEGNRWQAHCDFYRINLPTGVSSGEENQKLNLWPVPATEIINVNGLNPSGSTIEILNAFGQVVYAGNTYESVFAVNTSQLAAGFYTIRVTDSQTTRQSVFTKQ